MEPLYSQGFNPLAWSIHEIHKCTKYQKIAIFSCTWWNWATHQYYTYLSSFFFLEIQNHDTYSQYKFELNWIYHWWDIDVIKNHEKWPFLTIVPPEKYKYLNNGTIFFQTACVTILRTLTSKTYIKLNKIGRPRLSMLGRGLHGLAHIHLPRNG